MTTPETPFDGAPADWNLTVLDTPVILEIPDQLPAQPDALLITSIEALLAHFLGEQTSSDQIAHLAHSGIVALHTSSGTLEIHETLLGWTLAHAAGTPDPTDLAAAARLRAHRLCDERRHGCGSHS